MQEWLLNHSSPTIWDHQAPIRCRGEYQSPRMVSMPMLNHPPDGQDAASRIWWVQWKCDTKINRNESEICVQNYRFLFASLKCWILRLICLFDVFIVESVRKGCGWCIDDSFLKLVRCFLCRFLFGFSSVLDVWFKLSCSLWKAYSFILFSACIDDNSSDSPGKLDSKDGETLRDDDDDESILMVEDDVKLGDGWAIRTNSARESSAAKRSGSCLFLLTKWWFSLDRIECTLSDGSTCLGWFFFFFLCLCLGLMLHDRWMLESDKYAMYCSLCNSASRALAVVHDELWRNALYVCISLVDNGSYIMFGGIFASLILWSTVQQEDF